MKEEIERKFLVTGDLFKKLYIEKHHIIQGYLNKDPDRTVRVRLKNNEGWLTIKGRSNKEGTTRMEWEITIPKIEAQSLLKLAVDRPIEKIRYIIPHGDLTIEVDEFISHRKGLIMAEIELPQENTPFEKPDWLGEEVTGNPDYYNAMM
ncbi:MAG: adenylate cyclase [Flavobacteriales bacterium MED-G15]|jgi:adenylate cyclase|nr:MAG: adenylate cyclase [Flavobacteriales bacterium MED-G15]|tara:strand:- start:2665 stop:3111 length:447 start_codon:yes stop_codon:yes gene_type:complete